MINENALTFLRKMTKAANGMLSDSVYEEIFRLSAIAKPRNIVEIGTAHGAATIAIGLGALSESTDFSIWTVDKLGGRFSSRSAYGSVEANRAIVESNFTKAGISDKVSLFVGDSDEFATQSNVPKSIDFLMLDADGRIDRDLLNFYPRLAVGANVIIDDADNTIWLSKNHEGVPFIDNKHRTTELLMNGYCEAGFLTLEKRVNETAFCKKTNKTFNRDIFMEIALSSYRQLVIAEVDDRYWRELATWSMDRSLVIDALQVRERLPNKAILFFNFIWPILRRYREAINRKK